MSKLTRQALKGLSLIAQFNFQGTTNCLNSSKLFQTSHLGDKKPQRRFNCHARQLSQFRFTEHEVIYLTRRCQKLFLFFHRCFLAAPKNVERNTVQFSGSQKFFLFLGHVLPIIYFFWQLQTPVLIIPLLLKLHSESHSGLQ